MADDQGLSGENQLSDGAFSRATTGRAMKRLLSNTGVDGRGFTQREAPPDNPEWGDVYGADGTNWDPAGDGTAGLFAYDGGAWQLVVGL